MSEYESESDEEWPDSDGDDVQNDVPFLGSVRTSLERLLLLTHLHDKDDPSPPKLAISWTAPYRDMVRSLKRVEAQLAAFHNLDRSAQASLEKEAREVVADTSRNWMPNDPEYKRQKMIVDFEWSPARVKQLSKGNAPVNPVNPLFKSVVEKEAASTSGQQAAQADVGSGGAEGHQHAPEA